MLYVIQILAAILIGLSVGALLGPRQGARMVGAIIGIATGLVTIFTGSWVILAIGTAIYLITMAMVKDPAVSRA